MKNNLFILTLIFAASCAGNKHDGQAESVDAQNQRIVIKRDTLTESVEERIINTVMALPEAEAANRHIDSITNHQKGLASMMDEPEKGETDYSVRVGYNGDERFETYYFFYVNPSTLRVKILDVITDSIIPIEDWRKQNQQIK